MHGRIGATRRKDGADGSIVTTYLTDPIAIAPNYATTAIYSIRHAEGAVVAAVTPRAWPELTP